MLVANNRHRATDLFAAPKEGLRRGFLQLEASSEAIAEGDLSPETLLGQIQGEALVKANLASLKASGRTVGVFLDAWA